MEGRGKPDDKKTKCTAAKGNCNLCLLYTSKEGASVFPEFHAKDLDGNDVDSSIISKNAVTVLNFWFNGCSPCRCV